MLTSAPWSQSAKVMARWAGASEMWDTCSRSCSTPGGHVASSPRGQPPHWTCVQDPPPRLSQEASQSITGFWPVVSFRKTIPLPMLPSNVEDITVNTADGYTYMAAPLLAASLLRNLEPQMSRRRPDADLSRRRAQGCSWD